MEGIINNKSKLKRRITMISLFKKDSFKIALVALILILAVSGVLLTNPKTNTYDEQVTAKANIDKAPIVQEETEKEAVSTEPNKDVAPVPVQEDVKKDTTSKNDVEKGTTYENKVEKDTASGNKEDISKQNIKKTTTKVNNSEATSAASQPKANGNNKKYDFSAINAFWKNFRNAVISNNMSQVKKMTKFPLLTRGPMDGDPIIKFNEDKFDKVFQAFLSKDNGIDANSQLAHIKNSESLNFMNSKDYDNSTDYAKRVRVEDNGFRIGDMCFELKNNEWKLTFIYLDYDNYKKIG
jgi:hypothetical protein